MMNKITPESKWKMALRFIRRRLSFSLRTLMLFVTAVTLWIGWQTFLAREQREAVGQLMELGVNEFRYDVGWVEFISNGRTVDSIIRDDGTVANVSQASAPSSLEQLIGFDYLHRVEAIAVQNTTIEVYAAVSRLPYLRELFVIRPWSSRFDRFPTQEDRNEFDKLLESLKRTLPNVKITPVDLIQQAIG
jgi:hypothetical protein